MEEAKKNAERTVFALMCLVWFLVLPKPTAHPLALVAFAGVFVWHLYSYVRLGGETWLVLIAALNLIGAMVHAITTCF